MKQFRVLAMLVAHRMVKIVWPLLTEKRFYTETIPDRFEDKVTVVARRKVPALAY